MREADDLVAREREHEPRHHEQYPRRERRAAVTVEGADEVEITTSAPLLSRYRKTLNAFVRSAREFCNRRGMAYLLTRSDTPVDRVVSGYLRKQGLVR